MVAKLPSKKQVIKKIISNFIRPGITSIYLETIDNCYHITVVVIDNLHVIENLIELEEVVSDRPEKIKFFYKKEWSQGELVWEAK